MKNRRYNQGEKPRYDFHLKKMIAVSDILGVEVKQFGTSFLIPNIENRNEWLKAIDEEIREFQLAVKNYKQRRFNQGEPDANKLTEEMLERQYYLEARRDHYQEELDHLRSQYEELKIAKEQARPKPLARGPEGIRKVSPLDGKGHCDGQLVRPLNGAIVIDEPSSPYDGLSVPDYIQFIVLPWNRDKAKANDEYREAVRKNPDKEDQIKCRPVPWPKWPKDCVNHKEELKKKQKKVSAVSQENE